MKLDDDVAARPVRKLLPTDSGEVMKTLGGLMQHVSTVSGEQSQNQSSNDNDSLRFFIRNDKDDGVDSKDCLCNLVAHFFVARLYEGRAIQIRAHLLTHESEDNAHSHGSSFFSYAASGGYRHEIWEKQDSTSPNDMIYESVRAGISTSSTPFFRDAQQRQGRLVLKEDLSHEHAVGDLYYLDAADIFHKVCVRPYHLKQPVVSLVVRGKDRTFEDAHFVTREPLPDDTKYHSVRSLSPSRSERDMYLQQVKDALCQELQPSVGQQRCFQL
eukprot:TRINITY_DN18529_c0_g1_i1.p1 TRINITY_DN18529_c0_g1~~TRINITY_DN18529_c0_g1_i1.p1  ORF type:complete len:316 (-),score=35.77 TRINITY_DN18529_c0_g1_i1:6-818(-)